ncbi:hypothetical protein GGR50DRAFT_684111 [Xylaria sp. CBS 124048]|nr:hypothetical protein GGR50DRAFT_684111 [Xylaria sp. CBS 124048]
MLLKESSRILSCANFPVVSITAPASYTSCLGNNNTFILKWDSPPTRRYSSVSDPFLQRPSGSAGGYNWPTSRNPTPYEILAHSKDSQYNKALFYELVKIYHPDSNHFTVDSSIPHSVRLERYRLVVNANEILSNPTKRKAYDLYGAGWNGNRTMQGVYREADQNWRNAPGNASRNATWEDWEKWRQQRSGNPPPQTPAYMSNEIFVILLCSCLAVGGFAQARRANNNAMELVEMRQRRHDAIDSEMRRQMGDQETLDRGQRIERFLRQRDTWNFVSSGK